MIEDIPTNNKNSEKPITFDLKEHQTKGLSPKGIFLVVVLSFIFGSLGGAFGPKVLLKVPGFEKYFSTSVLPQAINQKVSLTEDSAVIDVVKKSSPAVVSVVISKDLSKLPQYNPFWPFFDVPESPNKPDVQQVGAGSGFFVSADGLIITNKHVVSDPAASYTVITTDGKQYEAKVLAIDPRNDVAIIKIEIQNAPFLTFTDSSQLQIGQRVIAIGNSLGQYQNTVTTGIVSGIGRSITAGSSDGSEQLEGVIQTDAAINPGNSGGPLLDIAAQVVGVNTAIDQQGQLVGFAIPSNDIKKALDSYKSHGKIVRPYIGVRYIMINKSLADKEKLPKDYGALLVRGDTTTDFAVVPGSPADKAGMQENDIILEVDGQKVEGKNTLSSLLRSANVGDRVTLKIYTKGEEKIVRVTLEEAK